MAAREKAAIVTYRKRRPICTVARMGSSVTLACVHSVPSAPDYAPL